jgi:DNA invertase Pin-like site-specific DNA recombinase
MTEKIQPTHLARTAYVYVRQSTAQQVRHHQEGQLRQYALADHAHCLGFHRTHCIDDDLGRSGSGRQERPGFARLLAAVCEGVAGAVFALEASRLARNNRDWHHLVDLCALTETLLVDYDGVYDPRQLNDRLLRWPGCCGAAAAAESFRWYTAATGAACRATAAREGGPSEARAPV